MNEAKQAVLDAGAWLVAERAKRGPGCSARMIASLSTLLARRDGNDITIHQQQISDIEKATADKGPVKLAWWFKYVRQLVEGGELDQVLEAAFRTGASSPAKYAESLQT